MKNKTLLIGLVALALTIFVPKTSSSKDGGETIVLSANNLLVLNSEVNGDSVSKIIAQAKQLDIDFNSKKGRFSKKENTPLYLFLNTPGGSIQSGLELIEALKGIGRQVNTVTLFSASMGFQIAQNLDDRLILKNGTLMSHQAAGEITGSFGGIVPSQMDSRYQFWLDRVKELDEQTVARTNGKQTYESYTRQYNHEMWLTGTKAVAQGYADRVILAKCDDTLNGVTTKTASFLGIPVMYDMDNCPMNSSPMNSSPMNVRFGNQNGKPLSSELEEEIRQKFLLQFDNKQRQVIPMVF